MYVRPLKGKVTERERVEGAGRERKDRASERARDGSSVCCFSSQWLQGPGLAGLKPGAKNFSHSSYTNVRPSSTASLSTLRGSWIATGAAGTYAQLGCQHCR